MLIEYTSLPIGQQQARSRWGTQASGEAFDRKKCSYLTEQAQMFLAHQALCVVTGLDLQDELGGLLVLGTPGFVQIRDEHTCLLRLDPHLATTRLLQRLQRTSHTGQETSLGLFFICHPTRQRLCVHGTAELLSSLPVDQPPPAHHSVWELFQQLLFGRKDTSPPAQSTQPPGPLWIRVQVRQAFFHCAKYIRTRVAGLTAPVTDPLVHHWRFLPLPASQRCLTENIRAFLAEQVLCFLCTVDQHGQCAVNHRNGHPGFLATLPPDAASPGGTLFLPDYAGNGAFEAIGNILETGQAALVIPNYVAQVALSVSGSASILEAREIPPELKQACAGAERMVALAVRRVELQRGDWSVTLAYERARAQRLLSAGTHGAVCHL
jgi:uncharacterized protein